MTLVALFVPFAVAADFDVGPNSQYPTLHEAVEAASSAAGNTVRVEAGTYPGESLDFDESMTITVHPAYPGRVELTSIRPDDGLFKLARAGITVTVTGDFHLDGGGGRVAYVDQGSLVLDGVQVVDTGGSREGGAVWASADATALTLRDVAFSGCRVAGEFDGGAVRVEGGSLVLDRTTFDACSTNGNGAAVAFSGAGNLTWTGGEATSCTASGGRGGAVWIDTTGRVSIEGAAFTGNRCDNDRGGGAIYVETTGSFVLGTSTFTGNTSTGNRGGGALYVERTGKRHDVVNNRFLSNAAQNGIGGAVYHRQDLGTYRQNLFCQNESTSSGGGGAVGIVDAQTTWRNNVFLSNEATNGPGGALVVAAEGAANLQHDSHSGNLANQGEALWGETEDALEIVDDLFVSHTGSTAIDGASSSAGRVSYSAFWRNDMDYAGPEITDGGFNQVTDPLLPAPSADLCDPYQLLPQPGGSLDGNASDGTQIGAFGGVDPYPQALVDEDDDGYSTVDDCDDTRAVVNPGVPEIAGDGQDQNCDGIEDCYVDADGDGWSTSMVELGGVDDDGDCADHGEGGPDTPVDCDDGSSAVNPGAVEVEGDGVDQDCDGLDDAGAKGGTATDPGCACAGSRTGGGVVLTLAVTLVLRRRAR